MKNDLSGKAALVTGGTMGIGLACGLALGGAGAHVYLTNRWGSADESEVRDAFTAAGAPAPVILEADIGHDKDTRRVMERIGEEHDALEAFISNVCVVQPTSGIPSYNRRAMNKSLELSAWPLVSYTKAARKAFDAYPRYVVGISSDGPDVYYERYEYVALAKTVMEVLGRYMSAHLADEPVNVNMVRTRNVLTQSCLEIHGEEYPDFIRRFGGESHFVEAQEVGEVVLALCSGWLDALNGQVLNVDKGGTFSDNIMRIFHNREEYGL